MLETPQAKTSQQDFPHYKESFFDIDLGKMLMVKLRAQNFDR